MKSKTVIVGMSGGVDSSVAAVLLKEQGYRVIGLFMKNWDELDENGNCTAEKDYRDVVSVCEKLDIPYYNIEFVEEYKKYVFDNFVDQYKKGHTPNPDILCNREIKFKLFYEKAMELGADYLATGHYCRVENIHGQTVLVKGDDPKKDQSYFLAAVDSNVLQKVIFPIGNINKDEVRKIAQENNFINKDKKDSTGICFIGERNFKNFLSQYIQSSKGEFRTLNEDIVGTHDGSCFFTIGQRKGLGLGGPGAPWFVVKKNTAENIVYVERGEEHPALYADELWAHEIHWITPSLSLGDQFECRAKIRYRQKDQACLVTKTNDRLHVKFYEPQRAMTLGQMLVLYLDIEGHEVCLGGGEICELGASYFELGKELKR